MKTLKNVLLFLCISVIIFSKVHMLFLETNVTKVKDVVNLSGMIKIDVTLDEELAKRLLTDYDVILENNAVDVYVNEKYIPCNAFTYVNSDCVYPVSNKAKNSNQMLYDLILLESRVLTSSDVEGTKLYHVNIHKVEFDEILNLMNDYGLDLTKDHFDDLGEVPPTLTIHGEGMFDNEVKFMIFSLVVMVLLVQMIIINRQKKYFSIRLLNGSSYLELTLKMFVKELLGLILIFTISMLVITIALSNMYNYEIIKLIYNEALSNLILMFTLYIVGYLILVYGLLYRKCSDIIKHKSLTNKSYALIALSFILVSFSLLNSYNISDLKSDYKDLYIGKIFGRADAIFNERNHQYSAIESIEIENLAVDVTIYKFGQDYGQVTFISNAFFYAMYDGEYVEENTLINASMCDKDVFKVFPLKYTREQENKFMSVYYEKEDGEDEYTPDHMLTNNSVCIVVISDENLLGTLDEFKVGNEFEFDMNKEFQTFSQFHSIHDKEFVAEGYTFFSNGIMNLELKMLSSVIIILFNIMLLIVIGILGFRIYLIENFRTIFNKLIVRNKIIGLEYIVAKYVIYLGVILVLGSTSTSNLIMCTVINVIVDIFMLMYFNYTLRSNLMKLKYYDEWK